MPSANQCELSSVYVRYTDVANHGGVSEESIKDNASFDLVLVLEAGQTIYNTGAHYNLLIVLNDLSDSSKTVFTDSQSGSLGDVNWLSHGRSVLLDGFRPASSARPWTITSSRQPG